MWRNFKFPWTKRRRNKDKMASCEKPTLEERYTASMVLSAVGDAMGYNRGSWEFSQDGRAIHEDMKSKGGFDNISINFPDWIVSDDTVMHLATAEALLNKSGTGVDKEKLYSEIAVHYIKSMSDMGGRGPGDTCMDSIDYLKPHLPGGYKIRFNSRHGGCGAAMRAMCIGLRYNRPESLDDLIAVSVESGRMTHHHPTGFLGALAAALFTSYAIQDKPPREWGAGLISVLPRAKQYIINEGRDVDPNVKAWSYFEDHWRQYLELRGLTDGLSEPKFPDDFSVEKRDEFYNEISYDGWGGASGHDSTIIAYDALLGSNGSWPEFCLRGVLHGGDNDSTGAIGAAFFGALYGFQSVPPNHYSKLEYRKRITEAAEKLFELSQSDASKDASKADL